MNILEQNKIDIINFLPEEFREDFKKYSFIAGGAVYSHINNFDINDFDFFLKDVEFANKLRSFFENLAVDSNNNNIKNVKYNNRRVIISPHTITLKAPYNISKLEYDWQIITKWTGKPDEVISEFDFKHNMIYWDDNQNITTNNLFGQNIYAYYCDKLTYIPDNLYYKKQLIFNEDRARDISGVLLRIPKFLKKDFSISKKEYAKIIKKLLNVMDTRLDKYEFEYEENCLPVCTNYYIDEEDKDYSRIALCAKSELRLKNINREIEILDSYLEY